MEVCEAIKNHQYLEFDYEGHHRKVIPYAYGHHDKTYNFVLRALQVAGTSESGKFDFPKLFEMDKVKNIRIPGDKFYEIPSGYKKGDKHISPIECEL